MKRILLILLLCTFAVSAAQAQCLTSSIVVNTGYNPITQTAIAGGTNGGTPVPDPHWVLTSVSPGVAVAIAGTPITGLIEVTPGNSADVITPVTGAWVSNPAGNPGGWISCLNSNTYTDPGNGDPLNMTLGRPFRLCTGDMITINLSVASDNYTSNVNIDGVLILPPLSTGYNAYTAYTYSVFLAAGTHTLNIETNNLNVNSPSSNPTGLNVYGTIASATGTNSIVSESYASCATYNCSNNCNTLSLEDTLHLCEQTSGAFNAIVSGTDPVIDVTWTPATGLSNTSILNPIVTAGTTSGYYYVTVRSAIPYNLLANGDLSAGNTGFTTGYTLEPPVGSTTPDHYAVTTNMNLYNSGFPSNGDHTTGTGNMLFVDGSGTANTSFWCETVPVTPNTDYAFSMWVELGAAPQPTIQLNVNNVSISTFTTAATAGTWTYVQASWNSGAATSASICMQNNNLTANGNDFAVDDISFQQLCIAKDSIYLAVTLVDTTRTHADSSACTGTASINLVAPAGYPSYTWSTGVTGQSITVTAAGNYIVYAPATCSMLVDTFHYTIRPLPVVNLGNDTGFCYGNALLLSSVQPAGSTYQWSTGSTATSITVTTTGTYWLHVDNNGCDATDTIHVVVTSAPPVHLGNDTTSCNGALLLQSSDTYTGTTTYLWNTTETTPTIMGTATGTYWLTVNDGGCPGSDTIHISIVYDTVTLHTNDTSICHGQSVQVFLTGNPYLNTYDWLPTTGMPNSNVASPVIYGDTSATYVVVAHFPNCPDIIDSFHLDVQPNPTVSLGGAIRPVCEFDTLHLHAVVNPMWYTHYNYSWTPVTAVDHDGFTDVVFTAGDTTKVIFTVTTSAGCKAVDSVQINVYPGNFAHMDSVFDICPHDSVQLFPMGGVSYSWHPFFYISDTNSLTPWVHAITSQHYMVIATSQYGCKDTITADIRVHPDAVIYLPDTITIFPGESYQVSPQTNCNNFVWTPSSGLSNAYVSDPLATPDVDTKYYVYASTAEGCKTKDSITIYVARETELDLPNAFTPGSGVNSTFKIIKRGIATLNYFRIYNRWGNVVYESNNIDEGWDGTYKGKPQLFGVYVYDVEATSSTGRLYKKHGNVTLIR